jgi:hypothetical protein
VEAMKNVLKRFAETGLNFIYATLGQMEHKLACILIKE